MRSTTFILVISPSKMVWKIQILNANFSIQHPLVGAPLDASAPTNQFVGAAGSKAPQQIGLFVGMAEKYQQPPINALFVGAARFGNHI